MKRVCVWGTVLLLIGLTTGGVARALNGAETQYIYEVLLDTDHDVLTGGPWSVVQGNEEPHDEVGIDYVVQVEVSTFSNTNAIGQLSNSSTSVPEVIARNVWKWNSQAGTFDLLEAQPNMYLVATNADNNGLVEFGAPLSLLGNPAGPVRGVFHAQQNEAFDNDYTPPFLLGQRRAAPAQSVAGVGLVAVLLLVSGGWLLRRRLRHGMVAAALTTVLLLVPLAWAAQIVLDGEVGDWAGIAPVVTDPTGDSSVGDPAEDIIAGYAVIQGQDFFFRMDLAELCCTALF